MMEEILQVNIQVDIPGSKPQTVAVDTFLQRDVQEDPKLSFIFMNRKDLISKENDKEKESPRKRAFKADLRQRLSNRQHLPQFLWSPVVQELQGYFGSQNIYSKSDDIIGHVTWFHFEVKYPFTEDENLRVNRDNSSNKSAEYEWFKMGFTTTWRAPDQNTVICFNASKWMKDILRQRLDSVTTSEDFSDPYWVHLILIECVVICYNKSIWNLRDKVRVYEEERRKAKPGSLPAPNFTNLHEILRHALHASETINVAIETISNITSQQESFYKETKFLEGNKKRLGGRTFEYLRFQQRMLKSLLARAQANEARVRNEITLAFNIVAQEDARAQRAIASDSKTDSHVMKMISFITLIFLPLIIFSGVFSTSFFDFHPDGDDLVSNKFWIFIAVSITGTSIVVLIGFRWLRRDTFNQQIDEEEISEKME